VAQIPCPLAEKVAAGGNYYYLILSLFPPPDDGKGGLITITYKKPTGVSYCLKGD
jgi:hypothetical protein